MVEIVFEHGKHISNTPTGWLLIQPEDQCYHLCYRDQMGRHVIQEAVSSQCTNDKGNERETRKTEGRHGTVGSSSDSWSASRGFEIKGSRCFRVSSCTLIA